MEAKNDSSRYKKFVGKHGKNVFELEAIRPDVLKKILRTTIESVIDLDMFSEQVEQEKQDAAYLQGVRETLHSAMMEMGIEGLEDEDDG